MINERLVGFANAVDARPANARDTMHPTLFKRVAGTKLEEKERKKGRRRKKKEEEADDKMVHVSGD